MRIEAICKEPDADLTDCRSDITERENDSPFKRREANRSSIGQTESPSLLRLLTRYEEIKQEECRASGDVGKSHGCGRYLAKHGGVKAFDSEGMFL